MLRYHHYHKPINSKNYDYYDYDNNYTPIARGRSL